MGAAELALVEQKITKQVTIADGATGKAEVQIPKGKKCFLKGYGYTWYTLNEYTLSAGTTTFPTRTDQEGSTSIPVIYGYPFKILNGDKVKLSILNKSGASRTYTVVFYLLCDDIINELSVGGELLLATEGASGVASSKVSITDSTGAVDVDVIADSAGIKRLAVDTELVVDNLIIDNVKVFSTDGTTANAKYGKIDAARNLLTIEQPSERTVAHTAPTIGSASTSALAANAARQAALFINDSDETIYLNIGGAAAANTGIRLNANGGSYLMTFKEATLSLSQVFAICASGSKTLLVTEWD